MVGWSVDPVPLHWRRDVFPNELLHVRQLGLVCVCRRRTHLLAVYEARPAPSYENQPHHSDLFHRLVLNPARILDLLAANGVSGWARHLFNRSTGVLHSSALLRKTSCIIPRIYGYLIIMIITMILI